jgi:hypothetical protein
MAGYSLRKIAAASSPSHELTQAEKHMLAAGQAVLTAAPSTSASATTPGLQPRLHSPALAVDLLQPAGSNRGSRRRESSGGPASDRGDRPFHNFRGAFVDRGDTDIA